MKRVTMTAAALIAIAGLAFGYYHDNGKGNRPAGGGPTVQSGQQCLIPQNVETQAGYGEGGDVSAQGQKPFDVFSWNEFVALNCPGDVPNFKATGPGDSVPRVWETWPDAEDLFKGEPAALRSHVANQVNPKILRLMAKNEDIHPGGRLGSFLQATGKPLIDRNGNFVLFEIRVNPVEAEYLKNKNWNLTTYAGQEAYFKTHKDINFPAGSIEVKAAWRILGAGDDASLFYTRKATIFIAGKYVVDGHDLIIDNVTVGLVGMHIIHKTPSEPDWVWSTFEQNNNNPFAYSPYKSTTYSFFNPNCIESDCPINTPPDPSAGGAYKWERTQPYGKLYEVQGKYGTQVVKDADIFPETQERNQEYQAQLKDTVWQNYELIGTQWSAFGFRFPKLLANSVIETYDQASASCLDCHGFATTSYGKHSADFSFLLGIPKKPTAAKAK